MKSISRLLLSLFAANMLLQGLPVLAAEKTADPAPSETTTSTETTKTVDSSKTSSSSTDAPTPVSTATSEASPPVPAKDASKMDSTKVSTGATTNSVSSPSGSSSSGQSQSNLTKSLKGLMGSYETDLFSGGGNYSYPVSIPSGRNGMTPSVSLSYSTTNRRIDNVAGYGWALSTSSIFRSSNKGSDKLYTDNTFSANLFGSYEELVLTDAATNTYRPKIEGSFRTYILNSASQTWTVIDQSGNTFIFGSTAAARQDDPSSTATIYRWMLEKATDPNGNTMTFSYAKDQGQIYLSSIRYTGNVGATGPSLLGVYQVIFQYETRPDVPVLYDTAFGVTNAKRLKSIDLQIDSGSGFVTQQQTLLSYTVTSSGRSLLNSVQLVAGSLQYPATTFNYAALGTLANNNIQPLDVLTKITGPQGAETTLVYSPSAQVLKSDGTTANPNLPFTINTVVSMTVKSSSTATPQTTNYSYQSGHYYFDQLDIYKREYAGFGKVIITDSVGNVSIVYFHQSDKDLNNTGNALIGEYQDHLVKKGKVYRMEKYDNANHLFAVQISKWDKALLGTYAGTDRNFVFLSQSLNQSFEGGSSHRDTATSYTYDNTTGNTLTEKNWGEVMGNNDGTFSDVTDSILVKTTTYATPTAGVNIKAAPCDVVVTDGNNVKLTEQRISYDTLALCSVTKGNPTKQESWLKENGSYLATTATYNAFGQPLTSTDANGNTTTITYDSSSLYPATTTNAKNQTSSATYSLLNGQPLTTTDPNGAVTKNTYDGLGRLTKSEVTDPSNIAAFKTFQTVAYNDAARPVQILTTQFNGAVGDVGVQQYQYLDGFGNLLQTRKTAEGSNQFTVSSIQYDSKGRVQKELLPVFATGSAYVAPNFSTSPGNTFTYDAVDRVLSIANALGTTSTAYTPWKKVITDANSHSKNYYQDAYGNLVKVEELCPATVCPGGTGGIFTTNYLYDNVNRLTKITDAEGNIRTFAYDSLSRLLNQDMLHAPNQAVGTYGSWTYTYDNNGNLLTKTDPKAQIVSYTYDVLNRVTRESSQLTATSQPLTAVVSTYDTGANAKGRLSGVWSVMEGSTAGTELDYTYDILGRITSQSRMIDSLWYAENMTYDLIGNPKSTNYPNGMTTTYTYDNAYQLSSVSDGNGVLISNIDYAPTGAVSRIDNGNGVSTMNTYDINKLYRLVGKLTSSGANTHQNLNYTYDPVGNITNIKEQAPTTAARNVDYTYDNLDRLLSATYSGLPASMATTIKSATFSTETVESKALSDASSVLLPVTDTATLQTVDAKSIEQATTSSLTGGKGDLPVSGASFTVSGTAPQLSSASLPSLGKVSQTEGVVPASTPQPPLNKLVPAVQQESKSTTSSDQSASGSLLTDTTISKDTSILSGTSVKDGNATIALAAVGDAPAVVISPANNSTIATSSVTFTFTTGVNVTTRYFRVGNALGNETYFGGYPSSGATTQVVSGLPTNGTTIYVAMWSYIGSQWYVNDYLYNPNPATITAPVPGSTLTSSTATFAFNTGTNIINRWLYAGSTIGGAEYFNSNQLPATTVSQIASNLPTNGSTIYIRLWSYIGIQWFYRDYTYRAATVPAYQGYLDVADCTGIAGWAWDGNLPNTPINVDIYDGTTLISTVPANMFRQDLFNIGAGNGYHGYSLTTPVSLKNGIAHSISAKFSGTTIVLGTSPKTITCAAPTPTGIIQGYKLDTNNNQFNNPGATISVAGQTFGPSQNPYTPTVPAGNQTVTSSVPSGYTVSYSACVNCTSHPDSSYVVGSSATVNVPTSGFVDLWWKYVVVPTSNPSLQTFTYSPTGNILSKSDVGTYLYEKINNANPQAVTTVGAGANARTYQYDKNGNVSQSSIGTLQSTFTYDYRDRMTHSKKGTNLEVIYGYDHTYNRVKKWDKNGNKVVLYPFADYEIEGTANASGVLATTTIQRVNTSVGGGQSTSREFNGSGVLQNSIWHHTDHLTGSSVETNSTGALIETLDYNPFGSVRTNTKTTTYENRKKFTGKELDTETNLTYFGARYYDADIGRWMGVDPMESRLSIKYRLVPQQLNGYTYVGNNPVRYVDPDGQCIEDFCIVEVTLLGVALYEYFGDTQPVNAPMTSSCAQTSSCNDIVGPPDPHEQLQTPNPEPNIVTGVVGTAVGVAVGGAVGELAGAAGKQVMNIPAVKQVVDDTVDAIVGKAPKLIEASPTAKYIASKLGWTNADTLLKSYSDHNKGFGFTSYKAFAQSARDFFNEADSAGYQKFTGKDGNIRIYDPATNTFGSYTADGKALNYMKPSSKNYWDNQLKSNAVNN